MSDRFMIPFLVVGFALSALPLHAQTGMTLADAVRLTLERSVAVTAAVEHAKERSADTEVARGAFDLQLRTFASRDVEHGPAGELFPNVHDTAGPNARLTYGVGASRRFRSGLLVSQDAGLVRTEGAAYPSPPNVSTARISLTIPLLRDRGAHGPASSTERAASMTEEAARLRSHVVATAAAREVGFLYWRLVTTAKEVEILRRAEDRARRLAEETRILVDNDERPASDLAQLHANLAYREAVRIEAEQRLIEYRFFLGSAIGLDAHETTAISTETIEFPTLSVPAEEIELLKRSMLYVAMEERRDLAAADRQRRAAEVRLSAARINRRPRLDLTVGVGYSGAELGSELGRLISPFFRNVEGLSSAVGASYQWTAGNRAAHGVEARHEAQLRLRLVELSNLEQTARAAVETAVGVLVLTSAEVERAAASLALYRQVVETERTKFRMGMATLFDVIHAEEGLTRAELVHLATRERHAVTLLVLREATGTLVTAGGGLRLAVPADGLDGIPEVPDVRADS